MKKSILLVAGALLVGGQVNAKDLIVRMHAKTDINTLAAYGATEPLIADLNVHKVSTLSPLNLEYVKQEIAKDTNVNGYRKIILYYAINCP
jgi:hypothetical protein